MSADNLEAMTRLVVQAVRDRLGGAPVEPQVLEIIAREVVSAMSGANPVTRGPARDNGDGSMTTALGAVVPLPGDGRSLEICSGCVELSRRDTRPRAVVTTTGQNRKGVVSTISAQIAEAGGDIQDLSQTIVSDYFTMIMVVDIADLTVPFSELKARLLAAAEELGIHAVVMHEDVMRALQRV